MKSPYPMRVAGLMLVGIGFLSACGLLNAQGQPAGGRDGSDANKSSLVLVAHGLSMAIEASTLEALAIRPGEEVRGVGAAAVDVPTGKQTRATTGPGSGVSDGGRSPAPAIAVGNGVDTGPFSSYGGDRRTGTTGTGGGGGLASGSAGGGGGAGGTASTSSYGGDRGRGSTGTGGGGALASGAGGSGGAGGAGSSGGGDANTQNPVGSGGTATGSIGSTPGRTAVPAGGSRMPQDSSAMELHRDAMKSFAASDRLFKQALGGESQGRLPRFQDAAIRYAATLRRLCGAEGVGNVGGDATVGTVDTAVVQTEIGSRGVNDGRSTAEARGPSRSIGRLTGEASTQVAILNHAVKAALDSMELKGFVREAGSAETAAGRAILTHAREMGSESLQTVRRVLSSMSAAADFRTGPTGPGLTDDAILGTELVRALATQANEVVVAASDPAGERRPADGEQ